MRLAAAAIALCFTVSQAAAQLPDSTARVAIRAGKLIDGRGGPPITNAVILIQGDRITAVGSGLTIPANVRVIDLTKSTVLPGFIDCHTHVTSQPSDYYEDIFRKTPIDVAVMAHVYAKRTLDAGFTTIRDVGSSEFIDVALHDCDQDRTLAAPLTDALLDIRNSSRVARKSSPQLR